MREKKWARLTAVLFDLDGTLLPMDQDVFTRTYFKLLAAKLVSHDYEPGKLVDSIWAGTKAMVENDGSCPNEEAFWKRFTQIYGEKVREDLPLFLDFYQNEFNQAKQVCGRNPAAAQLIGRLKESVHRLVLATNPIFPTVATENRIRWAGLEPSDFEWYTTYENIGHCKPNPDYYRDILERLGCAAEECLMVGNDTEEDMIAETLGMHVFLLTDCLINRDGADISRYPHGSFDRLEEMLFGE